MNIPLKIAILSLITLCFNFFSCSRNTSQISSKKRIAILQTVQHPALDATYRGIVDGLRDSQSEIGEVIIDYQNAQATPLLAIQMAQKLTSEKPDVLVAIATMASQSLFAADATQHLPLIFSTVTDPLQAGLVKNFEKPEGYTTGVSNCVSPQEQLRAFKTVMPSLKRLGIIYNPSESNSVALVKRMGNQLEGIDLIYVTANSTHEVSQAAAQLSNQCQAIFVNNDNTALAAFDSIVKIAREQGLALFCSDIDMIDRGAVATLGPDQYEVGRQTAAMLVKVLRNIPIQEIRVEFPLNVIFKVNADECKRLGLKNPLDVVEIHE